MQNRILVLLFLLVTLPVKPIVADFMRFLHHLQLENGVNPEYSENNTLVVRAFVPEPAKYLETVQHHPLDLGSDQLTIHLEKYIPVKANNSGTYLQSTFLIDYEEAVFAEVEKDVLNLYGKSPQATDLNKFVYELLAKTMDRLYDSSSVVLKNKRGDCSEHAVLLTALLRKYQIPARTIHGVKLLFNEKKHEWSAFGHAWVEYLEDGVWKGLDPSFDQPTNKDYIANFALEDEGLTYNMAMINRQMTIGIQKLRIERQISTE